MTRGRCGSLFHFRMTFAFTTPRRFNRRTGDQFMSNHATISPSEAADRLAIRELVEAYPHCADRRDVKAQMSLFTADTHFVGQSTIFTLTADRATGEAYCLAHHVTLEGEKRRLMLASLRYLDTFVKVDGAWLFAERRLYVDWLEERTLS